MSTTKKPLKYLWTAYFTDGHVIKQPEDDRYSKHDDNAEWNPSSFRDILDYDKPLFAFMLSDRSGSPVACVKVKDGEIYHLGNKVDSRASTGPFKLIYFRNVNKDYVGGVAQEPYVAEYCLGYEYKNKDGKNEQRILTIDGQ